MLKVVSTAVRWLTMVLMVLAAGGLIVPTGSGRVSHRARAAVSPGVAITATQYPPLRPDLIAAVNRQQAPAHTHVVISNPSVSAREMSTTRRAVRAVLSQCWSGEGIGSSLVVAAGMSRERFRPSQS